MLLNLSGAHAPWFTRNILVLEDSSGNIGISEVPGGQKITNALMQAAELATGRQIGSYRCLLRGIKSLLSDTNDTRGLQTFDLRVGVHVRTAFEAACLDLLGKFMGLAVCDLLGEGRMRDQVPVLGYLFFVGDSTKADLGYRSIAGAEHEWLDVRDAPALDAASMVRQAAAVRAHYGVDHFKLKGGVFDAPIEADVISELAKAFPDCSVSIDPNGCWSLAEAIETCLPLRNQLAYVEDPCGAENGYSGREIMAEFKRATCMRTATNMIATDWREMGHAIKLDSIDIPLADPHFWTMEGSLRVGQMCAEHGLTWGSHSNNHFDISLAMCAQVAAAVPGTITAIDTHWIWQDGQHLTLQPHQISDGSILVDSKPGLGVEPDFPAIEKAHQSYLQYGLGARNDAIAMQNIIPGWNFNHKRPCLASHQ